jgi:hypothetical protein
MRNKTEKKKTYEFSVSRWVREEASFTVAAEDEPTAHREARDIIDNGECEWSADYDAEPSDFGYDFEEVEPDVMPRKKAKGA